LNALAMKKLTEEILLYIKGINFSIDTNTSSNWLAYPLIC
jgi:hypothetical protein